MYANSLGIVNKKPGDIQFSQHKITFTKRNNKSNYAWQWVLGHHEIKEDIEILRHNGKTFKSNILESPEINRLKYTCNFLN